MEKNNIELIDDIFDALDCAKEAHSLLPPLPANVKPAHFRILSAIYRIRDDSGNARVTNINKVSKSLLPNTIKFVNEMVELNILEKNTSPTDRRVVLVRTTGLGEQYLQEYIVEFYKCLLNEFSNINTSDLFTMIETISKIHQAIKKVIQKNY